MANKNLSGKVSAAKVRNIIRSITKEFWFFDEEEINGRAVVRDGYVNMIFSLHDAELQIKMRGATL